MHNILLIIDPQNNKIKSLSEDQQPKFIASLCNRVQYHAEEENDDIYGTLDKRYVSDKYPFIFKELTDTIINLPNVHIPIQNKHTLGSIDMVNQLVKLHQKYEREGGIKVEIIGTNENFESLIMAMTLKSLIAKIEVELNLSCIAGRIKESVPFAKAMGINLVEY